MVAEQERGLVLADVRPDMVDATWAERVLVQAQQVDDPSALWVDRTVLDGKAAEWRAYGIKSPGLVAAQRFIEIELAQLLGPNPGRGGDRKSDEFRSKNHDSLIPSTTMETNLRRLYGYTDFARGVIRGALAAGKMPPSLRKLIETTELFHNPRRIEPEKPPDSRQHFDVWEFPDAGLGDGRRFFGRMPPQVVENLLWFWTEPGQMVVDPFAGSGTTQDVAERMGRFVWASDLHPTRPTIQPHDITTGWPPVPAPQQADLILLDPPYWQQAAGRYSDDAADLGNQMLDEFKASWLRVVDACVPHLADGGRLAFIVSPTQTADRVVDHAFEMYAACTDAGLVCERRVIVTYQTQQASGQQVTWAREHRKLLKLYRDLVVLRQAERD